MPLVEEASVLVPPNEMNWPPKLAMAAATAFLVRTCELTEEKAKRPLRLTSHWMAERSFERQTGFQVQYV